MGVMTLPASPDASTHYASLDRVPPLSLKDKVADSEPPEDNLRLQRARLLSNGALADLAVRELQAASSGDSGSWALSEMVRIYQDGGQYNRAIHTPTRSRPNSFALHLPTLPLTHLPGTFPH